MAEGNPQVKADTTSTTEVPEGSLPPDEATLASEAQAAPAEAEPTDPALIGTLPETPPSQDAQDTQNASTTLSASDPPQEPDAIQPFIDKAFETIQHEVEDEELGKFLRAHIKTFREEWDALSDNAKDAYVHMMTSQLLQRKGVATRIKNYEEYTLPVPSAQATLFESIKQSQIKPKKRQPVLLMPPNLRPTYSLKK
ncbi:hypothetical protein [Limnohabitans sp.]|uniref:hypothetical protein n=1 Tax=Limnohabitans sp. TaxID=1907725 RepID=UPI00333F16DD